jgi:hypothetical protein
MAARTTAVVSLAICLFLVWTALRVAPLPTAALGAAASITAALAAGRRLSCVARPKMSEFGARFAS